MSCALPTGEDWIEEKSGGASPESVIAGELQDLADYIPQPVTGDTPVRSFTADSFVGIVDWAPGASVLFEGGTAYTAAVTLVPLPGYSFGEPEGDVIDNHDGTVTVTITFQITKSK